MAALLIRAVVCLGSLDRFSSDPDAYRAIAETIAVDGVFGLDGGGEPRPTAFRPPLYPYLLSWWVTDGKLTSITVATLHTLLGSLTIVLAYWTAQRLIASPPGEKDLFKKNSAKTTGRCSAWAPWLAAGLVAIDPILLKHCQQVMTETLAVFLVVTVLCVWSIWVRVSAKRSDSGEQSASSMFQTILLSGLLGVLLALAYLCRPTFLVWSVFMILMTLVWLRRSGYRWTQSIIAVLPILLVTCGTVAAWTARNARAVGHPIWATSHGGYTLLLGNNESFYDYLSQHRFGQAWDATHFLNAYQHRYDGDPNTEAFWEKDWTGPPENQYPVTEHDDDRRCYDAAVATIRRRPGAFVWSCVVRVFRLLSPFPHNTAVSSRTVTIVVGAFYLLIYAAVVRACFVHRKKVFGAMCWPIWALLLSLILVHSLYWSNMRMRAPAIPGIAILASLALCKRSEVQADEVQEIDENGSSKTG
ncbi:hypothetical protein Pla52n_25980 [Stieleria varia]|uniref:Glycosyltransferase RgtA/B/C/D-like domain-containing protein n=1 Tax=Stieleria varia TaxID=2528005 RepID=A0A5C6AZV1_9BACT|nr:hypothetical protein Pla52n_25980 [Stieleria varia]